MKIAHIGLFSCIVSARKAVANIYKYIPSAHLSVRDKILPISKSCIHTLCNTTIFSKATTRTLDQKRWRSSSKFCSSFRLSPWPTNTSDLLNTGDMLECPISSGETSALLSCYRALRSYHRAQVISFTHRPAPAPAPESEEPALQETSIAAPIRVIIPVQANNAVRMAVSYVRERDDLEVVLTTITGYCTKGWSCVSGGQCCLNGSRGCSSSNHAAAAPRYAAEAVGVALAGLGILL